VVLLGVALLSATAINTGRLGMSLSMHELSFSPRAIASAATISGLVTIPLTLLIGAISDRLGKRQSLWFVYLLAAGGVLVLSGATQLWQFWLAASLTLLAFCTNGAITSAFAAELIPTGGLTRGLSWVNTTISAGAILSFLGTGYLMDLLGPKGLFLITSTLPVVAASIVQLLPPKTLTTIPALPRSDTCSDPNALGEHRTPLLQTTNGCM
jgi:MFS family permease